VLSQSFASCPADVPHCEYCATEPPCESRCRPEPLARLPPGADCYFDEQCSGAFARCLQRVCRRVLHTHQRCDASDPNDVCAFGRKTCFRGRCQGLGTGEPCSTHLEGRDIDCSPGWHCFLGSCAPQLPTGHSCTGQHPSECVRGHRCNLAMARPRCIREYTLDIGEPSSDPRLCKSNHVHPVERSCSEVPDLVFRFGKAVVSARDCTEDSECLRADSSVGLCACKRWWDGLGTPGYCELAVQDSSRPAFKRFWEASLRLCHHDWSPERCAREADLVDVLRQINNEKDRFSTDPTQVKQCASSMLATEFFAVGSAPLRRRTLVAAAVVAAGAGLLPAAAQAA